jgi:hypothetical protein
MPARMTAPRTIIVDLDRSYDLRVLAALPNTLAMFAAHELETQLEQMARQRRAICFTLMAPVRMLGAREEAERSVATVLVCLHVAPELAARGLAPLMTTLQRTATQDADPAHELAAPLTRPGHAQCTGFYREAIYGEDDAYVTITTHTPAEIPAEAAAAVAAATRGAPVDIVTTVALTPHRPAAAQAIAHRRPSAAPTLH